MSDDTIAQLPLDVGGKTQITQAIDYSQSQAILTQTDIDAILGPVGEIPAFMTASLPLPPHHWLYSPQSDDPPAPVHVAIIDEGQLQRLDTPTARDRIVDAVRWALKAATLNGGDVVLDPDAVVQNVCYALLGDQNRRAVSLDGIEENHY
jgi:hypothetical protein